MSSTTIFRSGLLATATVALLTASPALAALGDTSVACRAAIAKSYPKLVSTAVGLVSACHKGRDKGTVLAGVNCNALSSDAANVDPKAKFATAAAKHSAAVDLACAGQDSILTQASHGGGPQYFVSCPVSCPGVTNPMTTMHQVGLCHACEAAAIADTAGTATMGMPTPLQSKENQKCHAAIIKGYGKLLATAVKDRVGCQGLADKAGENDLDTCAAADAKLKIEKARGKAIAGLDKACVAPATVATVGGCAADLTSLKTCTLAAWQSAADEAFRTNYEMSGTLCPSAIRTTIRGGCSVNGDTAGTCTSGFQTGTQLSVGWKGLGHGIDVTDNYTLAGDVTCPGTEKGSCGECTVDGISIDNPQYYDFSRCASDTAVSCDTPFGTDTDCGSLCLGGSAPHLSCTTNGDCIGGNTCTAGDCNYYLGPPLAISAGGTPTCTLNKVVSDITGTANPDDGTSALTVSLRSVVHSGISQSRPCPICRNDTTAQDGVKNGTCLGGAHDGDSCDVQGFDLSFAPTDAANPTAGNSLDCPPLSGANISAQGLAISLPLTTGTATKTAQDPCESPVASLDCFCGACSLDSTVSCETDTDCSSLGKGVCGAGGGADRKPNLCGDGICSEVPGQTDRGQCLGHNACTGGSNDGTICTTDGDCTGGGICTLAAGADFDTYCDGLKTAAGHGVLSCNDDADCDSYICEGPTCTNPDNWVCPGNNCGTCNEAVFRSCFLDPIEITGTPDLTNPILVGTFCLPPSTSGTVNLATGSPGPGVVQTDSLVELRY